jgi:hypothetical protein
VMIFGNIVRDTKSVRASTSASSCITVWHMRPVAKGATTYHNVTANGIDGTSYLVQYRVETTSNGSWSSWITPTESTQANSNSYPYIFKYSTTDYDDSIYNLVEWRVYTDSHTGTDLSNSDSLSSSDMGDDDSLFTTLAPSGPCDGSASGNDIQMDSTFVPYH